MKARACFSGIVVTAIILGSWTTAGAQSWGTAQVLSDPADLIPNLANKSPVVSPSASGGFHAAYRRHGAATEIMYRRWDPGTSSLGPIRQASGPTSPYKWGQALCESGNGHIHVVWENFASPLDIAWSRSTDGGVTFSAPQVITSSSDSAKVPLVVPVGTTGGADVLMSYLKTAANELVYRRWNGSSWSPEVGYQGCDSVYYASGLARSPKDGSVWKSYGGGYQSVTSVFIKRFNGTSWEPSLLVDSNGFFAYPQVAVNHAGQVMVVWDQDAVFYSRLYTPNNGFGSKITVSSPGYQGSVAHIPGTNNFYCVYLKDNVPYGRRWTGFSWGPEEQVQQGLPAAFSVDARVAVDPAGRMMACWEYWGSGNAQAYYAIKPPPATVSTGTMSGTVRDQNGAGVIGAIVAGGGDVTVSEAGGAYTLKMPVGTHQVSANKNFYSGQQINGVVINANQTTTVNFTITANVPAPLQSFAVNPGNLKNTVTWTNPASPQVNTLVVRFSTTGFPASPTDGTLLLQAGAAPGTSGSHEHTGLTNGVTYYYRAWAAYVDASAHYSTATSASGTPAGPCDFDRDGDVDGDDFGWFQRCLSGQAVPQNDPNCLRARLDGDNDVDGNDRLLFLNCVSGAGLPSNPNCL